MSRAVFRHRVLVLISNPYLAPPLDAEEEKRAIEESILASNRGRDFEVVLLEASTIHDFRRALLKERYTVLHFIGHGAADGLVFGGEHVGDLFVPPVAALAELLASHRSLQCVLLNACYSASQGELAQQLGVPYAIAVEGRIADTAAIEFSRGFYDALTLGHDVPAAFDEGLHCIRLINCPLPEVRLYTRPVLANLFVLLKDDDFMRIPVYQPVSLIGREDDLEDKACHILLPSSYRRVSHRHGVLRLSDGQATIEDIGSTHGTYVDGMRVSGSAVTLSPRNLVTLGGDDSAVDGVCALRLSWHNYFPT